MNNKIIAEIKLFKMEEKNNLNDLINLNILKEMSQDRFIDLLYSKKFNEYFTADSILKGMIDKNEKLKDDSVLQEEWSKSLIKNILPNTYPSLLLQSLRIKIIPFNEKLIAQIDKAIEINSYFVQDLELCLESDGFSGYVCFIYPYQTEYDTKLMDILTGGLPFQLDISIKQDFFIEDDQKAFIEENGDMSNEKIIFTAYAGNQQVKETKIKEPVFNKKNSELIKFDGLYKIEFCDALSFFWKQLNPICIYSGQSYASIIKEQNTPFDKAIKLVFDKNSEIVLKKKLPFICMNCQNDNRQYSFFEYIRYILQQFNLTLLYNYSLNCYSIVSDLKETIVKLKPVKNFCSNDKKHIYKMKQSFLKPYLQESFITNAEIKNAKKKQLKVSELKNMPKTIDAFKRDSITKHDLGNIFELKTEVEQTKLKNNLATKDMTLKVQSISMPCSFSILPFKNNFTFSTREWGLIFGKKDKPMLLHKTILKIEKTPLYSKNHKRHPLAYEDKQAGKITKDKITFKFEDDIINNEEFPLMFNCKSKFYFYNKDIWPKQQPYKKPLPIVVSGRIYTNKTDDEKLAYSSELFNYGADSSKNVSVNENYSSSDKALTMDPNASSRPRYQVKTFPYLWTKITPKNKQLIPVDMILQSYSNILFYFKAGTEVELNLYEEHAEIIKIRNYLAPKELMCSGDKGQNQAIVFEDRKEQTTIIQNSYKPSNKKSSFKIVHGPKDNGTSSNIEMNNKSLKITVNCKQ